jgi:uncharacterized protein (DUF1015 family)
METMFDEKFVSPVVTIPELLLPTAKVDLEKWAVIACDQFTQDGEYWKKVGAFVGGAPSALNMIYPEIYLNEGGREQRISGIHETMKRYLHNMYTEDAVLNPPRRAAAFVERTTKHGIRKGLLATVDLEQYDWRQGARTLIRATEGTIAERLPPRMEVRRGAALELPHIMLLVDDEKDILMPLLDKILMSAPVIYDTPLMMDGGSIRCRLLYRKNDRAFIIDTFEHIARRSVNNYGLPDPFLFAVGDGNHSLATAKAVWDEYKKEHSGDKGIETHPARYALVEIVNLYDNALLFEPIHRVVFDTSVEAVLDSLKSLPEFSTREVESREKLKELVGDTGAVKNRCGIVSKDRSVLAEYQGGMVATVALEPALEKFELDYIHGEDEALELAGASAGTKGRVAVLLPPFKKNKLFETVAKNGPLPRKSFSMGDACEKRFYLECRQLF